MGRDGEDADFLAMAFILNLGNFVRHILPSLTPERRERAQTFLRGIEDAQANKEAAIGRMFTRDDHGLEPAQYQKFHATLARLPDPQAAAQSIFIDELLGNQFSMSSDSVGQHRGELMREFVKQKFGVEEAVDEERFVGLAREYFLRKEAEAGMDSLQRVRGTIHEGLLTNLDEGYFGSWKIRGSDLLKGSKTGRLMRPALPWERGEHVVTISDIVR
jgi:hypothetical protein